MKGQSLSGVLLERIMRRKASAAFNDYMLPAIIKQIFMDNSQLPTQDIWLIEKILKDDTRQKQIGSVSIFLHEIIMAVEM